MCLNIKVGCKIEIAEKPIICKKVIVPDTDTTWTSCFMNTKHEYNKELQAVEHIESESLLKHIITLGFHAFIDKVEQDRVDRRIDTVKPRDGVCVFAIIPKDAEYCLGQDEDIVANKMIVFSSKEKLDEYLKLG